MSKTERVALQNGDTIEFIQPDSPPSRCGSKNLCRSKDSKYRLEFLSTDTNPKEWAYLKRMSVLANWDWRQRVVPDGADAEERLSAGLHLPVAIIQSPCAGVVWPELSEKFRFGPHSAPDSATSAARMGKLKTGRWFISSNARDSLSPEERGTFRQTVHAMLALAHSMDFLHREGLAFLDFSDRNILLDMPGGDACFIGAERIFIPSMPSPPKTDNPLYALPGFTGNAKAPESEKERMRSLQDANLYALAVFFYMLLKRRRPFDMSISGDAMDENALFSGKPWEIGAQLAQSVPGEDIRAASAELERMFRLAFLNGLRRPRDLPAASHWVNALESVCASCDAHSPETNASVTPKSSLVRLTLEWQDDRNVDDDEKRVDLDISAFLLKEDGKTSDKNMVYYRSPMHVSGCVWIVKPPPDAAPDVREIMMVDKLLIPPEISRIVFAVTVYFEEATNERTFDVLQKAVFRVFDDENDSEIEIKLNEEYKNCSACRPVVLVRKSGGSAWELNSTHDGKIGGLKALCHHYGISTKYASG